MKIFISWSGAKSNAAALALRKWIKYVVQAADPWMSKEDIGAGQRWSNEISRKLEESKFGIVCLTRDNLQSPWLMFEAGALAKSLSEGLVCPFLIDLPEFDIPKNHPLTLFQCKFADREGSWDLIKAINAASINLSPDLLQHAFDSNWPELESELAALPAVSGSPVPVRDPTEVLNEVLSLVRDLHRRPVPLSEEERRKERLERITTGGYSGYSGATSSITAILEAWNDLEAKLSEIGVLMGFDAGFDTGRVPSIKVVGQLLQVKKLDRAWHESYLKLREIRNKVAHGIEFAPNAELALTFVTGVESLKITLDSVEKFLTTNTQLSAPQSPGNSS